MLFAPPLIPGVIIRRYKRFLADVTLSDGTGITAHCPNSGSMATCWQHGWPVLLSDSGNPLRKLRYTLEMLHNGVCWIGVNTMNPNRIAAEAIQAGKIPGLGPFPELRREVPYGANSRIDLLGRRDDGGLCYIEIKNVTLLASDGALEFPDAVTTRGRKHLTELIHCLQKGHDAVMLFVLQRSDGSLFRPAWNIDPDYGKALRRAERAGVRLLAHLAEVSPKGIHLTPQTVKIDLSLPR